VKDKARLYQVQRHEQPEKVTVKLSELEERVGDIHSILKTLVLTLIYAGEGTRYLRYFTLFEVQVVLDEWLYSGRQGH
jgi:hypothetical protein